MQILQTFSSKFCETFWFSHVLGYLRRVSFCLHFFFFCFVLFVVGFNDAQAMIAMQKHSVSLGTNPLPPAPSKPQPRNFSCPPDTEKIYKADKKP